MTLETTRETTSNNINNSSSTICIGILKYTSRAEGSKPFFPLTSSLCSPSTSTSPSTTRYSVKIKTPRSNDAFVKVKILHLNPDQVQLELMEVLGPVGDERAEIYAHRLNASVARKSRNALLAQLPVLDSTQDTGIDSQGVHSAYAIDPPNAQDLDDCMEYDEHNKILTVYITDPTRLIPFTEELCELYSSAYDNYETNHMLPDKLVEKVTLSTQTARPSIYVRWKIKESEDGSHCLEFDSHGTARVRLTKALAYHEFSKEAPELYEAIRTVSISTASHQGTVIDGPEDLVAFMMVEYNKAMANVMDKCDFLVRHQHDPTLAAEYRWRRVGESFDHVGTGLQNYLRMTSPMRRATDLYNQHVYHSLFDRQDTCIDKNMSMSQELLNTINRRAQEIKFFHMSVNRVQTGYLARRSNKGYLDATVVSKLANGDMVVKLHDTMDSKTTAKINMSDRYIEFEDNVVENTGVTNTLTPVIDALVSQSKIRLYGVLKSGQMVLRITQVDDDSCPVKDKFVPHMEVDIDLNQDTTDQVTDEVTDQVTDEVTDRTIDKETKESHESHESHESALDKICERVKELSGFYPDETQMECANVITEGSDLLTCLPTGSGKTVVAQIAVLHAFLANQNVVMTTPIKALSNQMMADFSRWFPNQVNLVTGDIQLVKADPSKPTLTIMTTEIHRAEVMNAQNNPDAVIRNNVKVVIHDEIHYIRDADRGSVYEESLFSLDPDIQMVGLSATINNPEKFCEWLSRRRPAKLVIKDKRHVPLHIGALDDEGFHKFHGSHGQEFKSEVFHDKLRDQSHCTLHNLVNLVMKHELDPVLVFVLSRKGVMDCAQSIHQNLLLGSKVSKFQGEPEELYQKRVQEQHEYAHELASKVSAIKQAKLGKYLKDLVHLNDYHDLMKVIERGVAFHHGGMLPILREFVEILAKEKLIRMLFVTETFAVGINVPVKTVVMTQLTKPCRGLSGELSDRLLKPSEGWQMIGRAGRRGMDTLGRVIVYPLTDKRKELGKAKQKRITVSCYTSIFCQDIEKTRSKLKINREFVLRNLLKGADFVKGSLLCAEIESYVKYLKGEQERIAGNVTEEDMLIDNTIAQLEANTNKKMSQKQAKKVRREYDDFVNRTDVQASIGRLKELRDVDIEIDLSGKAIMNEWSAGVEWLKNFGFFQEEKLTKRGLACSMLTEGEPLIRGTVMSDNYLKNFDFAELAAWTACFTEPIKTLEEFTESNSKSLTLPLQDALYRSMNLAEHLETNIYPQNAKIVYDWVTNRSIPNIVSAIEPFQFGTFVKVILRVIGMLEEFKKVTHGMTDYGLENQLDSIASRLTSSIVTNKSLYIDNL